MTLLLPALLLPFVGAAVAAMIPRVFGRLCYGITLAVSGLALLFCALIAAQFAPAFFVQFGYRHSFSPELGVSFSLGLDGLALPFLLVSNLLIFVALWVRNPHAQAETRARETCAAMLLVQGALTGAFVAQDAIVFWCFWALYLLGAFLLVGLRGGSRRLLASTRLALSGFSSLLVLLGVLLYLSAQTQNLSGRFAFDFSVITRVVLPLQAQYVAMAATLLALVLSLPLLPLQGFWADTHEESSPLGSSVLLVGPALYAFLKILLPCFPLAAFKVMPVVAWLACAGIVMAAVCSVFEADLRRRVAWVAMGQTALSVIGFTSLSASGIAGGLLLMTTSTLSLGGLFLCLTFRVSEPVASLPKHADRTLFLPQALAASVALLPGLGGFAAFFILMGGVAAADRERAVSELPGAWLTIEPLWLMLVATVATVAAGALLLSRLRGRGGLASIERLGAKTLPLWFILLLLLALGVNPSAWLRLSEPSINHYVAELQQKIKHAAFSQEKPTHYFPTARTILLSEAPPAVQRTAP